MKIYAPKYSNHSIIYNWKEYNRKKSDNRESIVKMIYLYIMLLCSHTQKID